MSYQKTSEPRAFKVALIYMVEERTKGQIAELYEQLQACGITVFLFSKDMPVVESHELEMHTQIENADSVIICYSENFEKGRGYRHLEIKTALREQALRPPGNAYFIPIRLDDCKIPDYLSKPRMLNYFRRDHFEGIMRLGLLVQRKRLIEDGENIQEFYSYPQRGHLAEESKPQVDAPSLQSSLEAPGVWNVPYLRNPHFTGRDEVLNQLDVQLSSSQPSASPAMRRAALTQPKAIKGLGGIGKTQIAVEYAYRSFEQGRYQHICWINAATETMLIASFVEIAKQIPTLSVKDETDQTEIARAVKRWFEQCYQHWLLIFDNVEVDDFSLVQTYFPQRGDGSILLTTRAHSVNALGASSIEVENMGVIEGTKLLLRQIERFERAFHELDEVRDDEKTRVAIDETIAATIDEAINLVLVLDGFPLALEQASAYIDETECSLIKYQQLYRSHRQKLLARGKRQRKLSATDYPASVATTWSLSFQKIEQARPAAAELLLLCAFLAPDKIPEELIMDGAAYWPSSLQQASSDEDVFNETVAELLKYSLVKRLADTHILSIHRLVQVVQMDAIEQETQQQWAEKVVRAVATAFPGKPNEVTAWPLCLRYLDQAQACSDLIERYKLSLTEAADLLNRTGLYVVHHALYNIAEPLYQHALSIREHQLGAEHFDTATSLNNLAALYYMEGKYDQAEQLYYRALSIYQHLLGNNHPTVAGSLNNLAILYKDQGKYAQAELLYQRAIEVEEQIYGTDHPEMATSLSNLAGLYEIQGKYAQAEPLYVRSLSIYEQQLGANHLDTASCLNNLAVLYVHQGKYEQADPLYKRALSIYEKYLGANHPTIASCLTNLASLYKAQGKYALVEPLFQQVLAIDEQVYGQNHPQIAIDMNNLAMLYESQGKYSIAEPFCQRALAIREQNLGANHPDIAGSLNNLAVLYKAQEKYEQAELLYIRALSIYKQRLGADHPHIASSLNNLAGLYNSQRKYEQAEPLYVHVLSICEQHLGLDHPSTASSLNNLAVLYYNQGKYMQAEDLYLRALAIREARLGADHPSTANSLNNLAALYNDQGKYTQAKEIYQRALSIYELRLGPEHPATKATRQSYATLLQTMSREHKTNESGKQP